MNKTKNLPSEICIKDNGFMKQNKANKYLSGWLVIQPMEKKKQRRVVKNRGLAIAIRLASEGSTARVEQRPDGRGNRNLYAALWRENNPGRGVTATKP